MSFQGEIKERFLSIYNDLKNGGIINNDKALADSIGYSPQKLNEVLKGRTKFNLDFLQKFCTQYNQSLDWLVFGIKNTNTLNTPGINKNQTTPKLNINNFSIPLYDIETVTNLTSLLNKEQKPLDYLTIPNLPKCDGAIKVTGDNMYPLLKSGDIIIYKTIHDIKNDLFWGEMYLLAITTNDEEFITIKYIQQSEKGDDWVKLVSQNQQHQDINIKKDRIKALALVKANIRINSMS